MRTIKLVSALITLLALTSFAAATASAAETFWQWLPGTTGTTFTGKSGEAVLTEKIGGGLFTCTGSTSTGAITAERALGLITTTFKGCKAAGVLAINSLGDTKETIVVHAGLHNCVIKSADAGLSLKRLPVHLEISALSELVITEGSFIALITPDKKPSKEFALNIQQRKGVQEIEKCEGGPAESLTVETDENGEKEPSAEEANITNTFTFPENEEAMA